MREKVELPFLFFILWRKQALCVWIRVGEFIKLKDSLVSDVMAPWHLLQAQSLFISSWREQMLVNKCIYSILIQ